MLYQISNKIGVAYVHALPRPTVDDFIESDSVVIRDTIHGRGEGTIYLRCHNCTNDNDLLKNVITTTRRYEMKIIYKLCNNSTTSKWGEYKYDNVYNNIINQACLDLTVDDTTWGPAGYGKADSGITGWIMNKPGILKGGQTIIISDINIIRPKAYIHRYTLYEIPNDWTLTGQCETRYIIEELTALVE